MSHLRVVKREERAPSAAAPLVCFTGLSASGKSTLAHALVLGLRERAVPVFHLDNRADADENLRVLCERVSFAGVSAEELQKVSAPPPERQGPSPGEDPRALRGFYDQLATLAEFIAGTGIVAVLSYISPYAELRARLRSRLGRERYFEVHVSTPLEVCAARDPKGLYAGARTGMDRVLPGVATPFEAPTDPDAVIDTSAAGVDQASAALLAGLERWCSGEAARPRLGGEGVA